MRKILGICACIGALTLFMSLTCSAAADTLPRLTMTI